MLKHQVSRKVLINIYLSFIRPVLEYADIVWDNCTLHESNLLESVQVEAGRIITGLRINFSKTKLYEELGWGPLYKRREKHKRILMYKIINGHTCTPNYLSDLVQPYAENVHNYNLRQQISNEKLRLPYCNTVSNNKSFLLSTISLWNELPAPTKTCPSVETFKQKLNSNLKKVPEYFHIGNRKENIALCQIRNEASNLNLHLYHHHLTDRINCPNYDCPCEIPAHFFIHCPEYNNQRQTLKNTFTKTEYKFQFTNYIEWM